MPSGSEKDILMIIEQQGGETTLGKIMGKMRTYTPQYLSAVVGSLGRRDYLDWLTSGKIILTDKGRQSLGKRVRDKGDAC